MVCTGTAVGTKSTTGGNERGAISGTEIKIGGGSCEPPQLAWSKAIAEIAKAIRIRDMLFNTLDYNTPHFPCE
jgi:hypothetical protein